MLPSDLKIQTLMQEFGLPEEMATETIVELESKAEASPLMLLQQMNGGEGGQFIQFRMGPNYEMALLVAQVTGSVLVTDSGSRWKEMVAAQHRDQGIVSYPWDTAIGQFHTIPIDHQFVETYRKSQHHFTTVRSIVKSLDRMILDNDRDTVKLTRLAGQTTGLIGQLGQTTDALVTNKLKILSPDGGLYDSNVQRLLARSSCPRYDHQVRSVYGIGIPD